MTREHARYLQSIFDGLHGAGVEVEVRVGISEQQTRDSNALRIEHGIDTLELGSSHRGENPLHVVLTALGSSSLQPIGLSLAKPRPTHAVLSSDFSRFQGFPRVTGNLSNITSFDIQLELNRFGLVDEEDIANFITFLDRLKPRLSRLAISGNIPISPTGPQQPGGLSHHEILGSFVANGLSFPHLKTFVFRRATVRVEPFLEFLEKHKATLESIELHSMQLHGCDLNNVYEWDSEDEDGDGQKEIGVAALRVSLWSNWVTMRCNDGWRWGSDDHGAMSRWAQRHLTHLHVPWPKVSGTIMLAD